MKDIFKGPDIQDGSYHGDSNENRKGISGRIKNNTRMYSIKKCPPQ